MAAPLGQQTVNPRLGAYFGIVASAIVGLVFLLLIFEQLGTDSSAVMRVMVLTPIALAVLIGMASFAGSAHGFFAAYRLAPSFFIGLSAAATTLGGSGLVMLTGCFFFFGFDALAYSLGILLGLLTAAVLIVPYARKDGSFTLPSYLGRRFESRILQLIAAVALTVPMLLLLVAELKLGTFIASRALGESEPRIATIGALIVLLTVVLGGMRSLTWSGAVAAIVAILGLIAPVTIVALLETNIPLPQLTLGMVADDIVRLEAQSGIVAVPAAALTLQVPGSLPEPLTVPFFQPFTTAGAMGFLLLLMMMAAGTASQPALLARAGTAASVFDARRAMSWTILIVGVMMITLPALAGFSRHLVISQLAGTPMDAVPAWLEIMAQMGFADYDNSGTQLAMDKVGFARDSIVFLLPEAAGLPSVVVSLAIAATLAAVFAGAAAQLVAIAAIWTEDIVFAWTGPGEQEQARINTARGAAALAALLAGWLSLRVHLDPLTLFLWSMALSASAAFAPLVMSVWWKRISQWGATAAMLAGFGSAFVIIALTMAGAFVFAPSLGGPIAAAVGVPAGIIAAFVVSLLAPRPHKRIMDLVRDIRVPGGETVHDREIRLARVGKTRIP